MLLFQTAGGVYDITAHGTEILYTGHYLLYNFFTIYFQYLGLFVLQ